MEVQLTNDKIPSR